MINRLHTYYQVWLITAKNAFQEAFVNRWSNVLFLTGKMVRFAMSMLFLYLLKERQVEIASYTSDQVIVFFLTYQLIDLLAQVLYRGVYEFGHLIRDGEFDFFMAKPISPLFRSLTGKPDLNDALLALPMIGLTAWIISTLNVTVSATSTLLYIALLVNSMLIATSFHILVLVVGIMTTEVDNIIWTYRDLSRLGQFPVTIYIEPLRTALFFIVPIGLMTTIPSQVLVNIQPTYSIALTTLFGVGFFILTLRIWDWGLKKYSSASS